MLDLKALRCFAATARLGSLTRAGIELGISEPAVSQRLKGLERHLGVRLYDSGGGRIRLTADGQRVLAMAREVLDRVEALERGARGEEVRGQVTIAAHDPVQLYLLPAVVQRFTRAHPAARLRLVSRPPSQTIDLVSAGEVDLGVIPRRPLPDGLAFRPWRTFPACFLAPRGHPLLRGGRPSVRDLLTAANVERYPLIMAESEAGEYPRVRQALEREGLPLNVAFEVGTLETVKRYVARGLGVAVVSGICVEEADHERLAVLPVPPGLGGETTYGLLHRQGDAAGPALPALLALFGVTSGGA